MFRANNPFLDLLEALGDDGQQPAETPAVSTGNVRLPEYWGAAPEIWFARVELRFELCGITTQREKFAHVVNALTQEATRLVTDLIISPPAARPYTILKERLLLAHQLTPVQKAMKVMSMPALGDRRPSQLLADMLEYCPTEEEGSSFFRAAFIQRLPAELQVLLDGVEDGDLKDLATKADKLWAIRRPTAWHMAAVTAAFAEEETDSSTIAAVKQGGRGKAPAKTAVTDGLKKRTRMFSICYKHMKFGAAAYQCDDPVNCKWTGN